MIMAEEDIDRTSQILAFVLDSLQVVSYKWLSRKLSISSNESKRLLQVVAEQHDSGLDIIYVVSGWSKAGCPRCYSVKLVPKSKLQEAKDMLDGHISIHVYSIQPCIPKDPAQLWSAEYVQSEELFKQPSELINCLRDNRFSAVSCGSITRKVTGSSLTGNVRLAAPKVTAQSTSASKAAAPSTSATKVAALSTSPPQPAKVQAEVVAALPSTSGQSLQNAPGNSAIDMGTVFKGSGTLAGPKGVAATRKKTMGSGEGGSLANLWGRASSKAKTIKVEAQVEAAANTASRTTPDVAHDPCFEGSTDEEDAANFACLRRGDVKNKSKRTRRMVVDDDISDEDNAQLEDETIISLSSPEVPKNKKETLILPDESGKRLQVSSPPLNEGKEDSLNIDKGKVKKDRKKALDADDQTSKPVRAATNGEGTAAPEPKKRKVLKTRMDERGREVTEVVWEIENPTENERCKKEDRCLNGGNVHGEVQVAPSNAPSMKSSDKASSNAVQNVANKASGGKSSGKAAPKDAQQGRISSFFKKKN